MSKLTFSPCPHRRSSRTRRKVARKRASGKDPAFEEEYLLNSLRKLAEDADRRKDEVHDLVRALMRFDLLDEARALQERMSLVLDQVAADLVPIFTPIPTPAVSAPPLSAGGLSVSWTLYQSLGSLSLEQQPAGPQVSPPVISSIPWRVEAL
jgi:hypothetical protein